MHAFPSFCFLVVFSLACLPVILHQCLSNCILNSTPAYLSACLTVCLPICPPSCFSACRSVCLPISARLTIFACLSAYLLASLCSPAGLPAWFLSACLRGCLPMHISVRLYVFACNVFYFMDIFIPFSFFEFACDSFHAAYIHPHFCLSVCLHVCLPVRLYVCLSVTSLRQPPSTLLFVCLSVFMCVCLSFCVSGCEAVRLYVCIRTPIKIVPRQKEQVVPGIQPALLYTG
jgi:hypothetical protein